MESTIAVANYFIKKSIDTKRPISHMKLQKLIYFAHGWSLAINNQPLIIDPIEAWRYGPVISVIYHKFKHYGNDVIKELLKDDNGDKTIVSNPESIEILELVWNQYSEIPSSKLSDLTHELGSPWYETLKQYIEKGLDIPHGKDIPESSILKYFSAKLAVA